ncbi:unnamed protein product, partial [Amoebophrya sp. A25]|eukprot:GSA25T00011637001.1
MIQGSRSSNSDRNRTAQRVMANFLFPDHSSSLVDEIADDVDSISTTLLEQQDTTNHLGERGQRAAGASSSSNAVCERRRSDKDKVEHAKLAGEGTTSNLGEGTTSRRSAQPNARKASKKDHLTEAELEQELAAALSGRPTRTPSSQHLLLNNSSNSTGRMTR